MVCWSGQVQIKQEAVENHDHMVFASSAGDLTKVVAPSKVRRCLKVRTEYWLCELGKGRE